MELDVRGKFRELTNMCKSNNILTANLLQLLNSKRKKSQGQMGKNFETSENDNIKSKTDDIQQKQCLEFYSSM